MTNGEKDYEFRRPRNGSPECEGSMTARRYQAFDIRNAEDVRRNYMGARLTARAGVTWEQGGELPMDASLLASAKMWISTGCGWTGGVECHLVTEMRLGNP